jgi:hypothetical protein
MGAAGGPPINSEIFPNSPFKMEACAKYSTKTSCTMVMSATPFKKSAVLLLFVLMGYFLTNVH